MTAQNNHAQFGLLGRTLAHSWSPYIHKQLGSYPYALFEKEPDEVASFVTQGAWRGLNVTIPYKQVVCNLSTRKSMLVELTGAANTLVKQADGSIFAENTDVLGFTMMLLEFLATNNCIPAVDIDDIIQVMTTAPKGYKSNLLAHHKVVICGNGGASRAVQTALGLLGASMVVADTQGATSYDEIMRAHTDATIMVNTTPVGMYPACPQSILSLEQLRAFSSLKAVVDVVYNPLRSGLCMAAEALGIPYVQGLYMLVAQALFSSNLFLDTHHDVARIMPIVQQICANEQSIALIGMPGVGKTTCGRVLAALCGKTFVDLDAEFTATYAAAPHEFIQQYGEDAFREKEHAVCAKVAKEPSRVIACGGGIVCREENYACLHQQSAIVLLTRPLELLSLYKRPLSASVGVEELARRRMPRYTAWADYTCALDATPQESARHILACITH